MNQQVPKNLSPIDLQDWLRSQAPDPILVDVREKHELELLSFPFSVIHLPLSESAVWMHELPGVLLKDQPVVVLCHLGVRSWNFAVWLLEQGWDIEVWNLEGGMEAWMGAVDDCR